MWAFHECPVERDWWNPIISTHAMEKYVTIKVDFEEYLVICVEKIAFRLTCKNEDEDGSDCIALILFSTFRFYTHKEKNSFKCEYWVNTELLVHFYVFF